MSQSTLEVQASSPRRATPGFFPDNNLDVNGVEAADQTFPQKVVSLKQSSIVFLNVCVLGFAGIFSILFFFHYCFVFVLFCFIFSFLSQRDNHARRCRLCHLAPRFQPFCSTLRPLINSGKRQRALRRQGGVNSLDPSMGLYRLVIT